MYRTRILVVDDEVGMLEVCQDTLRKLPDTEILVEPDSTKAARRLVDESVDLLIADIRMPGVSGLELVSVARARDPQLAVLMMTAFPGVESAVESMRLGAADYVTKPFVPADLLARVKRLLEAQWLREENRLLRRQVERTYEAGEMVGSSPPALEVLARIAQLGPVDVDVLIVGATGTGKELVARALHRASRRREARFVPVNCAAIPDQLLESELFGHERGAYTGAQGKGLGLMEFANGGTFFLDELSQLPLPLQPKLLRVLQERTLRRLGGTEEIRLDVRIVAASSQDLAEEVRREHFRPDLYHRINGARIELAPLRERRGDIPLLVERFANECGRDLSKRPPVFSPGALEVLQSYAWPGNVRELQNVVRHCAVFARSGTIECDDLPDEILARAAEAAPESSGGYFAARERRLAKFEQEYLRNLMGRCHGDVAAAAAVAHLPRGSLYRLLKRHQVDPLRYRG
jgi:DNA-binding NtrC family response regulator